jgi:S-adenosylmethionine uptake transporter
MIRAILSLNTRIRAILCMMVGIVFFTANDSAIKWLSGSYPLHEIVLLRAVVAIGFTLIIVHLEGGLGILRVRRPWLHILRGLLVMCANIGFFLGLATLPLAETTAIFFLAPLFITALAVPILGEKASTLRWSAVIAGFIGVLIMVRPGTGMMQATALLPIGAALAYSLMQMMTRKLGVRDKASTLAFYVHATYIVVSVSIGLIAGDGRFTDGTDPTIDFLFRGWIWPTQDDLVIMIISGFLVAMAGYLVGQAYRLSEAAVIAPFEYLSLPLAVFWGYQLWGGLPDMISVLGMVIIAGSGLFVFYRETMKGRSLSGRR